MCVWSVCVCVECVCGGCIRCVFDYVRCSILCSTRYMMKLGVSGIQTTPSRYPWISLLIIILLSYLSHSLVSTERTAVCTLP